MTASMYLQDFDITNKSFEDLRNYNTNTAFWYLDPPYEGARNNNYYGVCDAEDTFDQTKLRDFTQTLDGKFIQSNFGTPTISDLYKDYHCHEIIVPSRLSSGFSRELLITNLDTPFPPKDILLD